MIPRRLQVKGFMCYREETEICFTGPSIWALCGANGAGKSTVFDAMLFALYGEHRMGSQKVWELVHRQADEFMVAFDFAIGQNEYRVKRTYSRPKKKGTMLALHLSGPDMPVAGRAGPQPIPGTEIKDGFDAWVLRTIGLNEKTFRVAVLLMQGQSDALLKLGGVDKHEILTQVIDLSLYEALSKLAGAKHKEQDGLQKSFAVQLSHLEEVDDTHVLNLEQQINEAKAGKEEARSRQLHLAELKEPTKRWQKLSEDEQQLVASLTKYTVLLDQAAQIEQRATRLDGLQKVIKPLEQIYGWQEDCVGFQGQAEQDRQKALMLGDSLRDLGEKLRVTQEQLSALGTQRGDADREQKALQPRLLELQRLCDDIDRLQRQQQKYRELDRKISAYSPDLEQQQQILQTKLDNLARIEDAQPHLRQFADLRGNWQQAMRDLAVAEQELGNQEQLLTETQNRIQLLSEQVKGLSDQLSNLHGEVASKKTLQDESKKHLTRFQSIDGQPTCSYCGLPLTSEHLADERQRIEAELHGAKQAYHETLAQYTAIERQKKNLEQQLADLLLEEKGQQQAARKCEQRCNAARSQQGSASDKAGIVLQILSPDYITLIQGPARAAIDLEVCLQAVYPTSHDLEELAAQLRDKPSLAERLQAVTSDVNNRAGLMRTREYVFNEILPLEQAYPVERITALLQEQKQASQSNTELLDNLRKLDSAITQQSQQVERLAKDNQRIEQEKGKLEQAVAVAETKLGNVQRSIEDTRATLPVEWQAQVERLSESLLADWRQEIKALGGAAEQLRDLQDAQQNSARCQQDLLKLREEKDLIPQEARQAPALLEKASEQANSAYQACEKQERDLSAKVLRLNSIRQRRKELEEQRAGAARLASSYKDLTNLLGRDGLQHYLLQKAETGIVYHANEILDHISGGTLRLELQSSTDKKTEALDMVAYNTAISASVPQPIRLLSGSQQFRVAVSLALGIGKYAGNENHRVESVIIDEGFGSLDENGRREMIQAIKELGDGGVLKCIIVVSHQREFFDEFPNRYLVELVDGSTQIALG